MKPIIVKEIARDIRRSEYALAEAYKNYKNYKPELNHEDAIKEIDKTIDILNSVKNKINENNI